MSQFQDLSHKPNLSFWELATFFRDIDFLIVGSGIVGLNAALQLKCSKPNAKVLVIERGILPYGASTKNAGFACFGSASEIMEDIENTSESIAFETIKMRYEGLQLLRKNLSDKEIGYDACGGYELFFTKEDFDKYNAHLNYLNQLYASELNLKKAWTDASVRTTKFGFKQVSGMLLNSAEGSIDTGKMMVALHRKCIENGVMILNSVELTSFQNVIDKVNVEINNSFTFQVNKLIITTNGFAQKLLPELHVEPARAQVLITKPIVNLKVNGTFHFESGYYYFRNVGNRLLFGGGRNLSFNEERTVKFDLTTIIQDKLVDYLQQVILPNTVFTIEHKWSGIMGVGENKKPIIKEVEPNVFCAVKMGGMGVAIGSLAGKSVAEFAMNS